VTPPEWGDETHVLEEDEIQEVVASLQALGEEWKGVSPRDLTRVTFVEELEPGLALYETADGRRVVVTTYSGDVLMDRYTLARVGVGDRG